MLASMLPQQISARKSSIHIGQTRLFKCVNAVVMIRIRPLFSSNWLDPDPTKMRDLDLATIIYEGFNFFISLILWYNKTVQPWDLNPWFSGRLNPDLYVIHLDPQHWRIVGWWNRPSLEIPGGGTDHGFFYRRFNCRLIWRVNLHMAIHLFMAYVYI